MKRLIFLFLACVCLLSCKNRETRLNEFAQDFNKEENRIEDADLKQSKAYYLNKKSVNIDFILNSNSEVALAETDKKILVRILPIMFSKNSNGSDLVKDGAILNLRVYNKFGVKIADIPLKTYSVEDVS